MRSGSSLPLVFAGMLIGQFLAMLDVQIVSSSVEAIKASVGATTDEVSWVQTSYLMAEIVAIPLASHWVKKWGAERVFVGSCIGFAVASLVTGAAESLDALILGRTFQGFVGGAMLPTVFAFAFSAFPVQHRAQVSVLLSLAATLAPTLGPSLGGYITEAFGWRWLFLMNVAPSVVAILLVLRFRRSHTPSATPGGFDWIGLGLLSLLLTSLQFVLEDGSSEQWLESDTISALLAISATTLAALTFHLARSKNPILEIRTLRNLNFSLGLAMAFVSSAALLGGIFILPVFLADVMDYSPRQIGSTLVVSGLCMLMTGVMLNRFPNRMDPRAPMVAGFALAAYGFWLGHAISAGWDFYDFALLQAWRAVGVMIAVTVTQTVMMSTLPPSLVAGASSLVFLVRNLGGAMGLAFLSTLLERWTAFHLSELSSRVPLGDQGAGQALSRLVQRLSALGAADPEAAAMRTFREAMQREALVLAFQDGFVFLAAGCACAACVALFVRPSPRL